MLRMLLIPESSPPQTHSTLQSLHGFISFKIRCVKYFCYKFCVGGKSNRLCRH